MLDPTIVTWILVVFGLVFIFLPIVYAQLLVVRRPHDQKTKDLLIAKGEDWRGKYHLRTALGIGWADLLFWLPMLVIGSIGVLLGEPWGYAMWIASGAISVYISIVFWFSEREYAYPAVGPLGYFTIYWGNFVYWGLAVIVYGIWRLA